MRQGTYRHSRLATVLTVLLTMLTPTAANMVGAAAGTPLVPAGIRPAITQDSWSIVAA